MRQPPDAIPTLDEVALEKEGKKGDGEAQAQAQQELNTCTHRKRTRWHPHPSRPSAVLQGNEEISGERPYPPGIFRLVVHPTTRAARGDSTDYRTRSGSEPSMATWRSRAPPSSRSPASVAAWAQAATTGDNGARSLVSLPCCTRARIELSRRSRVTCRHPRCSGSTARFVRCTHNCAPIDHHQTSCVLLVLFAFSDVYSTIPTTDFHLIPLKILSNNLKLLMVMISYRFPHSS